MQDIYEREELIIRKSNEGLMKYLNDYLKIFIEDKPQFYNSEITFTIGDNLEELNKINPIQIKTIADLINEVELVPVDKIFKIGLTYDIFYEPLILGQTYWKQISNYKHIQRDFRYRGYEKFEDGEFMLTGLNCSYNNNIKLQDIEDIHDWKGLDYSLHIGIEEEDKVPKELLKELKEIWNEVIGEDFVYESGYYTTIEQITLEEIKELYIILNKVYKYCVDNNIEIDIVADFAAKDDNRFVRISIEPDKAKINNGLKYIIDELED